MKTTTQARGGRIRRRLSILAASALLPGFLVAIVAPGTTAHAYTSTGVNAGDIVYDNSCSSNECIGIRDGSSGDVKGVTDSGRSTHQWDSTPDVSPDGGRIAFATAADDSTWNYTLHVMNSDGSNITELVPRDTTSGVLETQDTYPRWSPDGQWIVFQRIINKGGSGVDYDIDTVKADGSDFTTVASVTYTSSNQVFDQYPTWSPTKDSGGHYRIAYSSNDGLSSTEFQVFITNADGSGTHRASTTDTIGGSDVNAQYLNWSPDGSRIYFAQYSYGIPIDYYESSDGFTTDGGSVNQLQASTLAQSLRLSSDGNTLLYYRYNGVTTLGTSGSDSPSTLSSSTGENDPTFVPADWSMKHFAVLGDSYSAGEGVPDFISPSDTDGCHRSGSAFATVLDENPDAMKLSDGGFVACSGATTTDILNGKDGENPQTDGITSSDNIVILTVGGDDVGFKSFVTSCLTVGCASGSSAYSTIEGHIQNDLPGELSSFFGTLKDYTASKRVLVLGYPRLLPLTSSSFTCSDLSSGSRSGAMQVETDLNGAISAAVTSAGSPFEFVDADAVLDNVRVSPFAGHELCSSDPDFNAANALHPEYSYHPNAAGQVAYATLVTQYLSNNPTAP